MVTGEVSSEFEPNGKRDDPNRQSHRSSSSNLEHSRGRTCFLHQGNIIVIFTFDDGGN